MPAIALFLAVLLLAALAGVIAVAGNLRIPAILFAAPSLLALGYGLLLSFILNTAGKDTALSDTYFSLAADHASGISILFSMVGGLACWAMLLSGRVRVWFCLMVAGLMLVAAYFMLAGTAQLGLNGMPRRYIDYPIDFYRMHGIVAICAASLGAVLIGAIAWLIGIERLKSRRPEETFN
jgi:cytochrome c oxidase subunit 1